MHNAFGIFNDPLTNVISFEQLADLQIRKGLEDNSEIIMAYHPSIMSLTPFFSGAQSWGPKLQIR